VSAAHGFHYFVRTPRSEQRASLEEFHGHGYSYDGVDTLAFATAADAADFLRSSTYRERAAPAEAEFLDVEASSWLIAREHVLINGAPLGQLDSGPGIKVITTLRRLPDADLEDFRYRWRHRHGPYVTATAGISRYIQNHVVAQAYVDGEPRYDGLVEVWHRTSADQEACFVDPMMTQVQRQDIPSFIDTDSFFSIQCTNEEHWVSGERPRALGEELHP
jgi:uncharacterized protein (TIGR02118 family)